jgi:hypothetical protein
LLIRVDFAAFQYHFCSLLAAKTLLHASTF